MRFGERGRASGWALAAVLVIAAPAAAAAERQIAEEILKAAGRKKGLCVDLGCGSGRLALEIAKQSEFFVHALETDDKRVAAARRALDAAGLYGRRAAVEKGDLARLPYPDYSANLVVRGDFFAEGLRGLSFKEVLRVLQPGGLAYLGQSAAAAGTGKRLTAAQLRGWLTAAGARDFEIIEKNGVWARVRRARPAGMGAWSHDRRCGPGNNRCAEDDLVKPPFQTLWINGPRDFTKFGLVVASAGRLVLRHGGITHEGRWKAPAEPDLVQAFDGYNGVKLWEVRLPDLAGNGLVAVGDAVFAATTEKLLALNAADGRTRWALEPAKAVKGMKEWSYYACDAGMLVAGLRREPRRGKSTPPTIALVGLDPKDAKVKWTLAHDPGTAGVALGEGLAFYASKSGHVAALDVKTGRERWKTAYRVNGLRYHRGRVYASNAVFNARDGKVIGRGTPRGILVGNRALTGTLGRVGGKGSGIFATDLATGKREKLIEVPRDPYSPKTGIPDGGIYGRCIAHSASTHCYFFHYSGTVIADLTRRKLFPTESFRTNCRTGVIAGNGLVYNSASGCRCTLVVRGNVALLPVAESWYAAEPDAKAQLEKGPAFGAAVDASAPAAVDWPAYRHDAARSSVGAADLRAPLNFKWKVKLAGKLTPPVAAGGLVLVGSDDHSIYALDAASGRKRWRYVTGGPVGAAPACWGGRVYAGGQDGWVYCLRAADGKLVWRFRGGPGNRKAMVFGKLESLWPAGGGVIVEKGVVYFYAGRCSHDRVFVYALDATTGKVKWKNHKAGRGVDLTGPKGGLSPHGITPSGIIAASEEMLYVPQGPTFPAGFRKSDGKLLWWNRRGDSTERSNMNIQHLGGYNLSVGGGLVFAGGPNPFSGHRQRYIAVDARTGRVWGQDHPGFFGHKKVGRDPTGKTILPQNYKWGINVIHFGEGAAPVAVDGGIFVFGRRDGSFLRLKEHLATQFKKAGGNIKKWDRRLPGSTLIVAGKSVVVAGGKSVAVLGRVDGKDLWKGGTRAEGDVLPDGLAAARGRLFVVTSKSEVVCFGAR